MRGHAYAQRWGLLLEESFSGERGELEVETADTRPKALLIHVTINCKRTIYQIREALVTPPLQPQIAALRHPASLRGGMLFRKLHAHLPECTVQTKTLLQEQGNRRLRVKVRQLLTCF